jgi:hypothetical protein
MTYPLPVGYREEDTAIKDLEYLQQLYPAEARKCHKTVMAALNRLDYDGSMIYDEYPDRWQLHRLSREVLEIMKREAEENCPEQTCPPEKWEWMADMIHLVLLNEILRRRHCPRRGFLNF